MLALLQVTVLDSVLQGLMRSIKIVLVVILISIFLDAILQGILDEEPLRKTFLVLGGRMSCLK